MIRLDLATDDFIGARSQQQDAAAARGFGTEGGAILILADGLGGHTGGAEASRIVVETFRDAADAGVFDDNVRRHPALRDALERANAKIANGVDPTHGQRGMASTAVAATLANGRLNWVSVGDSHLYLWREGSLRKLNADHSQAGLMVQSGQYQPDDPEVLAVKSVLVSALTGRRLEIVDHPTQAVEVVPGDIVLLASDGLNTLPEPDIEGLISRISDRGAREISAALLDSVRDRRADRQDNTAVVVARIVGLQTVASVIDPADIGPPTEVTPVSANGALLPQALVANDDTLPLTQRATEAVKEPKPQAPQAPSAAQARPPGPPQAAHQAPASQQRPSPPAQAATPGPAATGARAAAAPDKGPRIDPNLKNPHAAPAVLPKKTLDEAATIPLTRPSRPLPRAKTAGGPPVKWLALLAMVLGLAAGGIYLYQMLDSGLFAKGSGAPTPVAAPELKRSVGDAVTPSTTVPVQPATATPTRPNGTPTAPVVEQGAGQQRSTAVPPEKATRSPGAGAATPRPADQAPAGAGTGTSQPPPPAAKDDSDRPRVLPPGRGSSVAPPQQPQQQQLQQQQSQSQSQGDVLIEQVLPVQPPPSPVPATSRSVLAPTPQQQQQQQQPTQLPKNRQQREREAQREREQQQPPFIRP